MRGTIRLSILRVKYAAVVGYSDGFVTDIITSHRCGARPE